VDTRDVFGTMRPYMPHWPATHEEAMRDLVAGVILKVMAQRPAALASWLESKAPGRVLSFQELPAMREGDAWRHARPRPARKAPPKLDQKRRASGERPEPDESD
jgi:hypothetical protein